MNIYDKAIKELQEVIGEYGMDYYNDKHFPITIKALERAKKEHELLELYKKLSNIYEKLYTMELSVLSLNSNYYELEIIKLKQQIKALEEEMK